jgi:hypothetical protein
MEDGRLSTCWLLKLSDPAWIKRYTWIQMLDMRNMHTIGIASYTIPGKDSEGNDDEATTEYGVYCIFKTPRYITHHDAMHLLQIWLLFLRCALP